MDSRRASVCQRLAGFGVLCHALEPDLPPHNMGHTPAECGQGTVDIRPGLYTEANVGLASLLCHFPGSKELYTPVLPEVACDQVSCHVPFFWATFLSVLAFMGVFLLGLRAHLLFPL